MHELKYKMVQVNHAQDVVWNGFEGCLGACSLHVSSWTALKQTASTTVVKPSHELNYAVWSDIKAMFRKSWIVL
jgi:hypothetical protein